MYEYAVEEDCGHGDLVEERPTTIPSKMIAEHTLPGLTDQEPLVLAVSDFLASILYHRAPVSDAAFSLRVLETLAAGEKSLQRGGAKVRI
jgi:hypothetical protein